MRLAVLLLAVLALAAPPAAARQDDQRLPALFERLKTTRSADEARPIEAAIWHIWSETEDDDVGFIMRRGLEAMAAGDRQAALKAFDNVVERDPGFAEGWNKRATVLFLLGDYPASVRAIERTLALEPRHFGALSGLGQIYLAYENKPAALKAFEAALRIHPHLIGTRAVIDVLRREVEGNPT